MRPSPLTREIDRVIHHLVRIQLAQVFGDRIQVVGEESADRVSLGTGGPDYAILLDSVDGTDLCARGVPIWGTAMAFFDTLERRLLASFVADPMGNVYPGRARERSSAGRGSTRSAVAVGEVAWSRTAPWSESWSAARRPA